MNSKTETFDYSHFESEVVDALKEGQPLIGKDGVLTPLLKRVIEASLEGEMSAHLSDTCSNRRNGKSSKMVKSTQGSFSLETPRDRDGSFEPQLVKKRQTILNDSIDQKVLALYGLGMSYQDISAHLAEMYGLEVSSATLGSITDKVIPAVTEWRSRPLDQVYPIVFMDAMFFKIRRDGRVRNHALYSVLGIQQDGRKDILGIYVCEKEGASFWMSVLSDLKERGVEDILIACVDGLKGFPKAIQSTFPGAQVQLCIVHMIRNSLKYVIHKDRKAIMADLKLVYKAPNQEVAYNQLQAFEETWGKKYPIVVKSWKDNWENLSHFFLYPHEIRRVIYTTNPVESFHAQIRKVTRNKPSFTSENALIKLVYCAIQKITDKWNMPIPNWALTLSQLDIYFEGRIKI